MTVSDLIAELKVMPQDAVVLYRHCSDYAELNPGDVEFVRAEDERIVWREANGHSDWRREWAPPGTVADFRAACLFPGL